MIKGSKAWHEVTAIVTKFFDNLKTTKYNYMGFLRSIDRIKYDSGVCIAIFEKIVSRTSKESTINEKIKLEIIEYCNENIIFLKDSKIDDEGFRAMNDFSNFGKSYLNDLEYCKTQYGPAYTEINFLMQGIEEANDKINNKELFEKIDGNKAIQASYNNEEKALFRQRIFKFEKRITELKSRIDVGAVIAELNHGQKILSEGDVISIMQRMNYLTDEKFKYFDEHYLNNDFKDNLKSVFAIATNSFHELSEVQYSSLAEKKLTYVHIIDNNRWINSKLLDFKRFFGYIKDINHNDCIKLYNAFNNILEGYESICMQHGYIYKKSFCYETINNFKKEIKENYDGPIISNNNKDNNSIEKDKVENEIEKFEFITNNFNPKIMTVKQVKEHFKQLLKYTDEDTINKFLYHSFELRMPPESKLSFNKIANNKGRIKYFFYEFYLKCSREDKANKYAMLLSEYFNGFILKDVLSNWHTVPNKY